MPASITRAHADRVAPNSAQELTPHCDPSYKQVVAAGLLVPPEGFARWTVRLLAEETVRRKIVPTIGREAIRMLLQSHDLKPWRGKNVVRLEAR